MGVAFGICANFTGTLLEREDNERKINFIDLHHATMWKSVVETVSLKSAAWRPTS